MDDEKNLDNPNNSGCGCAIAFLLIVGSAIIYIMVSGDSFKLQPGEANQSMEALQKTFDNIDKILPDSLIITEDLDPRNHYMSAKSFGNLFYGLNPVLEAAAKADTSRKYRFQYVARVDHVDVDEFVIRDFLVDSIWRYEPYTFSSENPFGQE